LSAFSTGKEHEPVSRNEENENESVLGTRSDPKTHKHQSEGQSIKHLPLKDHLANEYYTKSTGATKNVDSANKLQTEDAAPNLNDDDFTKIIGIGPKIASILRSANILCYQDIVASSPADLKSILLDLGGSRYKMNDPSGWKPQAELAAKGQWEELQKMQDEMVGAGSATNNN
jgi:predicted flap endonuclease-1-like 5' DNA nuclease